MKDNKLNLMIGFPNTGKTTFVAALWKYLKDSNSNDFSLGVFPSNREYLEQLVKNWIQCLPVARTSYGKSERVSFTVQTKDGKNVNIEIPDIAGETYSKMFFTREIEKDHFSNLSNASGLIVFISSQTECVASHNRFGGDFSLKQTSAENQKGVPFNISDTPVIIQLVDILQTVTDLNRSNLKVAIIISAWDIVNDDISPEKWVKLNLPLLYNFIKHNFEDFKYFGLSAQGGDYNEKKEELLALESPIDRIKIYEDKDSSNDITLPLQYLIKES